MSSSFVRAVPGAISRDPSRSGGDNGAKRETTGVGGAQKLCKAWISTKYIAKAMQGWGDEVVSGTFGRRESISLISQQRRQFFLELWANIAADSSLRVRADEDKLMPMPPPARSGESDSGSIFDKLIEEYDALAERAEDMAFQHVCGEIEMELKVHFFRYVQTPKLRALGCPFGEGAPLSA